MRKTTKRKNTKNTKPEEINGESEMEQQSETDQQSASENPPVPEEKQEQEENCEPEPKKRRTEKRKGTSKKKTSEDEDTSDEANYEVEAVLDEKKIKGVRHFLIRWKGYKADSDTWEPESTVNCPELIKQYYAMKKTDKKLNAKHKKTITKRATKTKNSKWDKNEQFEVESIIDVNKKRNGKREFLVSWKGYPKSQNSWEPEENLACNDLIKKFMAKAKKTKSPTKRASKKNKPK